jgi:wyosine [tRNA(Phe)-imidazoG37] synthetase (radical SAM superfamily)
VSEKLTVFNHDRDSAALTYVYPVVSRRARGVSVGINLNPDNTCNFRCIYCQVPGLIAGNGPPIDLPLLERELRAQLDEILHGNFMQERVPDGSRRLNDVAFSGNGEPTTSPDFAAAVDTVLAVMRDAGLLGNVKLVLITNGSRTDRADVEPALRKFGQNGGEIWFKLDAATQAGAALVNSSSAPLDARIVRLRRVASVCPTWLQTCFFKLDDENPPAAEVAAYVNLVRELVRDQVPIAGVLLYGLARPSYQPEAPRLSKLPPEWFEALAAELRALGVAVTVSV